jgi:3-dehydroquinate dehydratase / shikimate dehydrogenase
MGAPLFGVIIGPTIQEAVDQLSKLRSFVEGVELRLDYFTHIDKHALKSLIINCRMPIMLTLRRKDQGGSFPGSEQERLDLLESLCGLGAHYIDLEYDIPQDYKKRLFESHPQVKFLSSFHDFAGTPPDLEEVYQRVRTPYAHIYKIAVTAHSSLDALKMLALVQKHSHRENLIGIAMGKEGVITRILAPVVGSFLTYAALEAGNETAPGQLSAEELQEIYRFRTLNRHTQIYGLIGDPVDKSMGALIHNAVFKEAEVNAVYVKMQVKKEELEMFFSLVRQLPFQGLSVTMPLKEAVLPYLSELSFESKQMGSCNTIQITPSALIGHTTDGKGALDAIERKGAVSGKQVVVVGAGGAAKAIVLEAVKRGALVTVINRTSEKAIEIAKGVGCRGGGWDLFPTVCQTGYDVIINCIPEGDLIDAQWILPGKIAMDIIYVPKNTPFLTKASQKKCRLVFGYEMFVGQALGQERIWFGEGIDMNRALAIMEKKVRAQLEMAI